MHRIDAPGFAPGNLFTEGNPGLGIPASEVSDDWLNDVQEELVTVIEDAGITLVKGTQDQLKLAIQDMIANGGGSGSGILQAVANNASATNIGGLLFDPAIFRSGSFDVQIDRRTDTQNIVDSGNVRVAYNPETAAWETPKFSSDFDASGLTFSQLASGQIQVASDDLTGTTYAGNIRVTNIKKVKITL